MKDTEFAKEMELIAGSSALQPERFNHMLGLRLLDCSREEKWVEFLFAPDEWCRNPSGGVHGGVISSLFDTATGMGAVGLTGMNVTTTDLTISFLKPFNGAAYVFHIDFTNIGKRMVRGGGQGLRAGKRKALRHFHGKFYGNRKQRTCIAGVTGQVYQRRAIYEHD